MSVSKILMTIVADDLRLYPSGDTPVVLALAIGLDPLEAARVHAD